MHFVNDPTAVSGPASEKTGLSVFTHHKKPTNKAMMRNRNASPKYCAQKIYVKTPDDIMAIKCLRILKCKIAYTFFQ